MKKRLSAVLFAATFLLACACTAAEPVQSEIPSPTQSLTPSPSASEEPSKKPLPETSPVSPEENWAKIGRLERKYLVYEYSGQTIARWFYYYIPSSYQPGDRLPLMFTLHGSASNASYQMNDGNWINYAEQEGFIMVAPESVAIHADGTLSSEGKSMAAIGQTDMKYLRWNAVSSDPQGAFGVDDVQYISDLIDLFTEPGYADAARVYSSGLSHGAFMSLRLAMELPEKIAGVGVVAGLLSREFVDTVMDVHPKIVFINGTADVVVPIDGMIYDYDRDGEKEYVWAYSQEDSVNWFLQQYGMSGACTETALPDTDEKDGTTITRYGYTTDEGDEMVVQYIVTGGGHTWPGGRGYGYGVTSRDAEATLLIWNDLKDVVNPAAAQ